ncbi:hypothetical protein WA577_006311 [Blastocystis sp. JDR]
MFSGSKLLGWFKHKNDLSLDRMKELHKEIIRLHDIPGVTSDSELTEVLRELAEIMVHGEKQSDEYFSLFLEENMLQDIISIIKQNRSNKIKIQIIQTISILIQNIKNKTSLFFLLSNNHINDLITTPLDFMDEDVVSQYISFLKLLSMNLTTDTVQFFYNYTQSGDPFPLFSICSKFYDNPEPMVRIAVRTITLNCLKVNDKNIVAFMGQPSTLKYFKKLVYYVISLVVTLNKMIEADDYSRTGELMNNVIDQLFFLQDVLNIQVEAVNEYLKRLMMEDFFLRYCYDVITRAGGQALISLRTSLFLLTATINTMKEISLQPPRGFLTPPRPAEAHVLAAVPRVRSSPRVPTDAASTLHHRSHTTVSTINLSPKEEEEKKPISLITVLTTPLPSTQSNSPREEAVKEVNEEAIKEVNEEAIKPVNSEVVEVNEDVKEDESELVLDSSSSDDEAEAALMNAVSLQSVRQRAQASSILLSGHASSLSDTALPTAQSLAHPTTEPITEPMTQATTLFTLLDCDDDVQRLQALLALMSTYHQSVYNGLTLTAQQAAFAEPPPGLQGYFLCNDAYGAVATHALCSVLKATTLRPVTAQCAVYVMKYLLANHVYGDVFPAQVLEDLADTLKVRAGIVATALAQLRPLLQSPDDVIYAFLTVQKQVESVTGTGAAFMPAFDYKGILESSCVLLPFARVRNTLSAAVPMIYKFTEPSAASAAQSLQAFSMQLFVYLLLRAFVFFLLRKQLVLAPPRVTSPVALAASPDPAFSFSPQPLSPASPTSPTEQTLPADFVADASAALGIAVDGCGGDIEFKKTVNAPAIAVDERVEITRVNRYLPCSLLGGEKPQSVYLAIGRSQLSLLEMVRGSMKEAVVRCVFSLFELLDICVEDNSRRTLSLLIQTDGPILHCEKMVGFALQNRPGRNVFKVLLQFATAPACLEAQRCIMVARNKDMEKRNRDIETMLTNNANSRIACVEKVG